MTETPLTLGEYWAAGRPVHFISKPHRAYPYKCGAIGEGGSRGTVMHSKVTCTDCLDLIHGRGVGTGTPLYVPPEMGDAENNGDGVFTFTDTHLGKEYTLEVVPQTTGNVEITISDPDDGHLFTLHHLDRMDLVRALLYDFHYSPERGGPHEDD